MSCTACEGSGFILASIFCFPEKWEIQRCDGCEIFPGDDEALKFVYETAKKSFEKGESHE